MLSSVKHRNGFCFKRTHKHRERNDSVLIYLLFSWVNRMKGEKRYKTMSVSSWPYSSIKKNIGQTTTTDLNCTVFNFYINWRFDIFKRFYSQQKAGKVKYLYYLLYKHLSTPFTSFGQRHSSAASLGFDFWLMTRKCCYNIIRICVQLY